MKLPYGCMTFVLYEKIHTIHFINRNLSKYVQIWPVEHSAENPVRSGVIFIEKCLMGHSIGHQPNTKEEKEKENILHLWKTDICVREVAGCLELL